MQTDLIAGKAAPVVQFDGQDDSLLLAGLNQDYHELTVFMIAAPRTNGGAFRGLLAFNKGGMNDYTSGMTLDLNAFPTLRFNSVNIEELVSAALST